MSSQAWKDERSSIQVFHNPCGISRNFTDRWIEMKIYTVPREQKEKLFVFPSQAEVIQ
jgi:hypothetical protein